MAIATREIIEVIAETHAKFPPVTNLHKTAPFNPPGWFILRLTIIFGVINAAKRASATPRLKIRIFMDVLWYWETQILRKVLVRDIATCLFVFVPLEIAALFVCLLVRSSTPSFLYSFVHFFALLFVSQGHPTDRFGGISVRETCNRLTFSVREMSSRAFLINAFGFRRDTNNVLDTKIGQPEFSERQ